MHALLQAYAGCRLDDVDRCGSLLAVKSYEDLGHKWVINPWTGITAAPTSR